MGWFQGEVLENGCKLRSRLDDGGSEGSLTTIAVVLLLSPLALLTVNLALKVPGLLYTWLGFGTVLVALSPKSHNHPVMVPREESEKFTVRGPTPLLGVAVKLATGGGGATVMDSFLLLFPLELLTVSVTSKVPAPAKVWLGF
jgi:hypothetical protein